jgi:hypothetical protein
MTKNNTSLRRKSFEKSALNGMAHCYDRENARTTKNGAIIEKNGYQKI